MTPTHNMYAEVVNRLGGNCSHLTIEPTMGGAFSVSRLEVDGSACGESKPKSKVWDRSKVWMGSCPQERLYAETEFDALPRSLFEIGIGSTARATPRHSKLGARCRANFDLRTPAQAEWCKPAFTQPFKSTGP